MLVHIINCITQAKLEFIRPAHILHGLTVAWLCFQMDALISQNKKILRSVGAISMGSAYCTKPAGKYITCSVDIYITPIQHRFDMSGQG